MRHEYENEAQNEYYSDFFMISEIFSSDFLKSLDIGEIYWAVHI